MKISSLEIDTKNMTLEELLEFQKKLKKLYSSLALEIALKQMNERNTLSSTVPPAEF